MADSTALRYSVAYPEYLGAQWDATTTNLTYRIPPPSNMSGPLNLTISFLSPITPDSTLRQSIPASYISIHAQGSFSVDLYMDINGGWVSGNDASKMKWDMTVDELLGLRAWKIQKEEERRFEEFNDHGEWGRLYFTAPGVSHIFGIPGQLADVNRTSATSAGLPQCYDSSLQRQVRCVTKQTMTSEPYKTTSQYLHFTKLSNLVGRPIDTRKA